jgi:hypothetical protein
MGASPKLVLVRTRKAAISEREGRQGPAGDAKAHPSLGRAPYARDVSSHLTAHPERQAGHVNPRPAPACPAGEKKEEAMKTPYEHWAAQKLKERACCTVEPSLACIPLRDDPICRTCWGDQSPFKDQADQSEDQSPSQNNQTLDEKARG